MIQPLSLVHFDGEIVHNAANTIIEFQAVTRTC